MSALAWRVAGLVVVVALIALWAEIAALKLVSPVFLPTPERVWTALEHGFLHATLGAKLAGTISHMLGGWLVASIIGVALGVQYLGYVEFSELQYVWRRTAERKRVIANNVELRRAVEALNHCADVQMLCGILRNSLHSIGFDGFRLERHLAERFADLPLMPLQRTQEGELQLFWDDEGRSESIWELRLELSTGPDHRLGRFSLLRIGVDSPLLVDFNLLSCEFRMALSYAILRTMNGHGSPALLSTQGKGASSVKVVSAAS